MHLANALLRELETPGLSLAERARLRCRLAKQLERGGDYNGAEAALSEFWDGIGTRPRIDDLDAETGAHLLLRAGTLTGWLGASEQVERSQESAKDLISESARAFEALGLKAQAVETQTDLALCYWREGAFDEARAILHAALSELDEGNIEQRAIALLRLAIVERDSTRLSEALQIHNQAAPLFEKISEPLLVASFHLGRANLLNRLSSIDKGNIDRALIEYTAASINYERAGHERYHACVENNLGYLYCSIGEFDKAHEHLDYAQVILTRLKDNIHLAQVDETRARVLLAEGRIIEAEKTVRSAIARLEKGDQLSLFAEALTTHGITLARLNHAHEAKVSFEQAINVAERTGDFERAGIAALTLIEQLGVSLSTDEVLKAIDRTGVLLEKSQDIGTVRRLSKAAFDALFLTQTLPPEHWDGFSLEEAVRRYRGRLIKLALEASDGSVTRAARLLGYSHHQSLIYLISHEHKELLNVRKPITKRRKQIFSHPKKLKRT